MGDGGMSARHSSETNEHYTPQEIVEAARSTLGGIDLDPASCPTANATVKAAAYFTAVENGFSRPWSGRVFLNTPGGRCDSEGVTVAPNKALGKGLFYADGLRCSGPAQASAKAWWFRLAQEFVAGRVSEAVFVGFSLEVLQTTQVNTPNGLPIPLDFALCFPTRRVAYIKPDGTPGGSPPHASVIVYLGPNIERFWAAFSQIGKVVLPR